MTTSFILIGIAIAAIFFLLLIARSQRIETQDMTDLSASIRPVDLEAFRNLMSPHEEQFLRSNLARSRFRHIQRRRLVAAISYVQVVAMNAVILMRMAEAAQNSSDPEIVTAGRELAEAASRLRIYSLLVLAKLYVAVVLPGVDFSPAAIAEQYQDLCRRVSLLSRLRVASGASKITASL